MKMTSGGGRRAAIIVAAVTMLALTAGPAGAATDTQWVLVPISSPSGPAGTLQGVVCFGSAGAWSVGSRLDQQGLPRTWTQHWDGTAWQTVDSPDTKNAYDRLVAVGGASADDVWAVGYTGSVDDPDQASLLVLHGNVGGWSLTPAVAPGAASSLAAIDMVNPNDGWAVGAYRPDRSSASRGLILHWSGAIWQQVTAPDLGQPYHLTGVSGSGANGVWAVGYTDQPGGNEHSVVLRWDGQSWKNLPGIDVTGANTVLYAVSAPALDQAWAVGYSRVGSSLHAYVLRFSGGTWQPVPVLAGSANTQMRGVVALPNGVWAAGYSSGVGTDLQLMLSFDGTEFRVDPLPAPPPPRSSGPGPDNVTASALRAIAGSPDTGELWTLGWLAAGCPTCAASETYVLHRPAS